MKGSTPTVTETRSLGQRRTARLVCIVGLAPLLSGCGRDSPIPRANPVGPSVPATPAIPTLSLSGVVAENGHPIANALVNVSGLQPCSSGCSFRQFHAGMNTTDTAGRYRVVIRRPEEASVTVWALASKDGYVQQCVATRQMQTDATLDVGVTSLSALAETRPRSAPGSRTISGVVFEATPTGKQPVEGARVGWEGLFETVVAETQSDAAGLYSLCGLPVGQITGLFALKQGYSNVSYASVGPGTDSVVDIEITRR